MERLTMSISGAPHGAEGRSRQHLTGRYCRGKYEATAVTEKLYAYEKAEEEGTLFQVPCKTGTEVYFIQNNEVKAGKAIEYRIEKNGIFMYVEPEDTKGFATAFSLEFDYGHTVFLKKEKAEKALTLENH